MVPALLTPAPKHRAELRPLAFSCRHGRWSTETEGPSPVCSLHVDEVREEHELVAGSGFNALDSGNAGNGDVLFNDHHVGENPHPRSHVEPVQLGRPHYCNELS